jgi:hypothetical protein
VTRGECLPTAGSQALDDFEGGWPEGKDGQCWHLHTACLTEFQRSHLFHVFKRKFALRGWADLEAAPLASIGSGLEGAIRRATCILRDS